MDIFSQINCKVPVVTTVENIESPITSLYNMLAEGQFDGVQTKMTLKTDDNKIMIGTSADFIYDFRILPFGDNFAKHFRLFYGNQLITVGDIEPTGDPRGYQMPLFKTLEYSYIPGINDDRCLTIDFDGEVLVTVMMVFVPDELRPLNKIKQNFNSNHLENTIITYNVDNNLIYIYNGDYIPYGDRDNYKKIKQTKLRLNFD